MGLHLLLFYRGILNDLGRQTQKRLMKDLIGDPYGMLSNDDCIPTKDRKEWEILTTLDDDVKKVVTEVLPFRMDNKNKIITLVVKKNVNVLEHLLNSQSDKGGYSIKASSIDN